jgi:hypothetical protein
LKKEAKKSRKKAKNEAAALAKEVEAVQQKTAKTVALNDRTNRPIIRHRPDGGRSIR